jgi:hypothetical protein
MHVGDGTWDSTKDTFLLPNIQGLDFDTLRYNGMGNRFSTVSEYHTLILGHGILAGITFLGIVPAAILIASFYHRNPHLALRLHIYLQILTVILATVVLVLGYFAVGPSRSLTNPHHGIGVAIYVLVLIQAMGGALVHRIEKGKMRYYLPIKLMLHQWLGRGIALLAIAQIPIGLALYGAPLYLFILYTVAVFTLLVLYFVLTYQRHKLAGLGYDEASSILTATQTDLTGNETQHPPRSGLERWAAPAMGGAGLAALRRRFSGHRDNEGSSRLQRQRRDVGRASQVQYGNGSVMSEKQRKGHTWRNRMLGAVGGATVFESFRRFTSRHDERSDLSDHAQNDFENSTRPPPGQSHQPHQQSSLQYQKGQQPVQQYPLPNQQYQPPDLGYSALAYARAEEGQPRQFTQDEDWRRVAAMEAAQARNEQARPSYPPGMATDSHLSSPSRRTDEHEDHDNSGTFSKLLAAIGLGGALQRRRQRKKDGEIAAARQRQDEQERLERDNEHQPLVRPYGSNNDTSIPNVMESPTRNDRFNGGMSPRLPPQGNEPYGHGVPADGSILDLVYPISGPSFAPPPPQHHDFAYPTPPPVPVSQTTRQPVAASFDSTSRRNSVSQGPPPPRVAFAPAMSPGAGPPPRMTPQAAVSGPAPPPVMSMRSTTSLNTTTIPPVSLHVRHSANHLHVRRLSPQEAAIEREARRRAQVANTPSVGAAFQHIARATPPAVTTAPPQVPAHTSPQPVQYPVYTTPQPYRQAPVDTSPQPIAQAPMSASPAPATALSGMTSSPSGTGPGRDYERARAQRRKERLRAEQARLQAFSNDGPS